MEQVNPPLASRFALPATVTHAALRASLAVEPMPAIDRPAVTPWHRSSCPAPTAVAGLTATSASLTQMQTMLGMWRAALGA